MYKALTIIISVLFFCQIDATAKPKSETPELRIGAITSLSGAAAKKGKNWLEGAKLAVDDLRDNGVNVKFIVEDDQTNPRILTTAFNKLVNVDKAEAIIGGTWDFLAEAAIPLAERHKIPFITPSNPEEILSDSLENTSYSFANGLSLKAISKKLETLLLSTETKTLAVYVIDVEYGHAHAEIAKTLAQKNKIKITKRINIPFEGFKDHIRNAALDAYSTKPDSVLLITNYEGVALFLKDLGEKNFFPNVFVTQALDEAFNLSKNQKHFKNAYGIYPAITNKDFINRFTSKYGYEPQDFAASGYDALMFIVEMLSSDVALESSSRSLIYTGVTGLHILKDQPYSLVDNKAVIMKIIQGKLSPALL